MGKSFWDSRRRLRLEIIEVRNLPSEWQGRSLTIPDHLDKGGPSALEPLGLPAWAEAQLREYVASLPEISCTEAVLLTGSGKEEQVLVNVERYIDARVEQVLEYQAQAAPQKEALADVTNGVRYTYGALQERCVRLAGALYRLGVRPGSHVSVILPTCADNFTVKFSINRVGGVIVNVNYLERGPAALGYVLRSDSDTLIMRPGTKGSEFIDALYDACPEMKTDAPENLHLKALPKLRRVIICGGNRRYPGTFSLEALLEEKNEAVPLLEVSSGDVATIIHTSGSSATPKGVMLTHRSIIEVLCQQKKMLNMEPSDRTCLSLPLFHAFGSIGTSLPTFMAGGTVVCVNRPSIPELVRVLREERCTVLCNVPSVYQKLLQEIHAQNLPSDQFRLKKCVAAGAASTEQMLLDISETLGVKDVIATYGMTETCTGVTGSREHDSLEARTQTVGAVWPGVHIRFINPETGEVLPTGQVGEICVRGFNVMKGYYNAPEETSAVLSSDGWLRTGDLGRMREDGNVCFVGRLKESIKKHGETISPLEVENVLQEHPCVTENHVVGVPDDKAGEEIVAFVSLLPGTELTAESLKRYARKTLPRFKIPKYIFFVDTFPKSATGKVQKRVLRARARELLGLPPEERI